MDARGRGVVLYGGAAALLAAGAVWWFAAAPSEETDARIEAWRASVERVLPEDPSQDEADTIELPGGIDHEVTANVGNGVYEVAVVCAGEPQSRVRVSLGEPGTDSGRGLACGDEPTPETFPVGVAGQLRLQLNVSDDGPVVFRYAVQRQP